jgi:hypothetical protein
MILRRAQVQGHRVAAWIQRVLGGRVREPHRVREGARVAVRTTRHVRRVGFHFTHAFKHTSELSASPSELLASPSEL